MTVKIGFIGPANAGKTILAEFYTEFTTEPTFNDYHPTLGLRIFETERRISKD